MFENDIFETLQIGEFSIFFEILDIYDFLPSMSAVEHIWRRARQRVAGAWRETRTASHIWSHCVSHRHSIHSSAQMYHSPSKQLYTLTLE